MGLFGYSGEVCADEKGDTSDTFDMDGAGVGSQITSDSLAVSSPKQGEMALSNARVACNIASKAIPRRTPTIPTRKMSSSH